MRSDPISHLLSLQNADGSIWWKNDSAGMSFEWTANGIMALTGGRVPAAIFCWGAKMQHFQEGFSSDQQRHMLLVVLQLPKTLS